MVGVALVASWLVAAPFTCYPTYRLVPRRDRGGETRDEQAIYSTRFCRGLPRTLEFCVARPLVVVAAAVAALALGLFQFGQVQQQVFPRSERPELFLEMRLTQGSAIQASKKVAAEAEQLLAEDPDIASYTTYIGRSSPRFWLGLLPVPGVLTDDGFEIVNVVKKHVVQLLHGRVNVPRHCDVHEKQRAVAPRGQDGRDILAMQNGVGRAGRTHHNVRHVQRLPAFVKTDGPSAKFRRQLFRALHRAVGHQHGLGTAFGEMLHAGLAHFSGA